MIELLREKGIYLAAWLPTILASLAVVTTALLWILTHDSQTRRQVPMGRRVARWAAWMILPGSIIGLGVSYGPMAPLFGTAQRLRSKVGEAAPDMTFTQVEGGHTRRLSEFRGKVLLVNLWATWCPPCRKELPTLNRLQEALGERGLVVVTLSDEPRERLTGFLQQHAPRTINGRVDSFGWLAIRDFRPFTLVIDRTGVLRDYSFGEQDYETFGRKVEKYL